MRKGKLRPSDHIPLFSISILDMTRDDEDEAGYGIAAGLSPGRMWMLTKGIKSITAARKVLKLMKRQFDDTYRTTFDELFGHPPDPPSNDILRIVQRAWGPQDKEKGT
ncbi:MAG: hypothetical protein ABFE07_28260 [Armatimonadia bacterium]